MDQARRTDRVGARCRARRTSDGAAHVQPDMSGHKCDTRRSQGSVMPVNKVSQRRIASRDRDVGTWRGGPCTAPRAPTRERRAGHTPREIPARKGVDDAAPGIVPASTPTRFSNYLPLSRQKGLGIWTRSTRRPGPAATLLRYKTKPPTEQDAKPDHAASKIIEEDVPRHPEGGHESRHPGRRLRRG